MSKYQLRILERKHVGDYQKWLRLIEKADGVTLFHHPDFLGYHGDKFNETHIGVFKGEELFGLIPMAIVEEQGQKVGKSPYGASYGGFIFSKTTDYAESAEIAEHFIVLLKSMNVQYLRITPSLPIYYHAYSDTFIFALLERGMKIINSDISNAVDVQDKDIMDECLNSKTRNLYKKALKNSLLIVEKDTLDVFWNLLEITYEKHATVSTHSKQDLEYLMTTFPGKITCDTVYLESIPVAAIAYFEINNLVTLSFYHVQNYTYKHYQPLTYLIVHALNRAKKEKKRYYDFGTSSVNMVANPNNFHFKEGFGAKGFFRMTYGMKL